MKLFLQIEEIYFNLQEMRRRTLAARAQVQLTESADWRVSMANVLAMVLRKSRRSQIMSSAPFSIKNSER